MLQAAQLYALVSVSGAGSAVRDLQNVSNQVNKTQGVMSGIGKGAGQMGKGFAQVGAGMLRIGETLGLAAVGAVAASAKVGASFQSMTELIHTQAGATQSEVEAMRTGIMAMVHDVGTTPQELAKGIYHIESVGLRGAKALDVLRASALGAKVGLADMESVTNALTAVTYSQITGTKNASDAMAILDGIVGVGNMHLQDLTDSFKSGILGTGAAFGVTLQSLGAAIATLTDAGVPANIAATRLNMTISHMGAPTAKAIDTLKGLGISQFQLASDMRGPNGIDAALRDIGKHMQDVGEMSASGVLTPKGVADLTKIFGGSRFGATAMQLLTNAMADAAHGGDRLAAKYKLISERAKTFNDNVEATKQTAGYVWGLLVADIQNAALAFSQGFLPALARAGSKLDAFVFSHLDDIKALGVELGNWIDKIDWNGVEKGASTFASIMKTVLDVVGKLPPQLDLAIVAFLALNKVSGGLLGAGVGNIVGGLTGILGSLAKAGARSVLSKIPVVGGALAAATSTPVFVTNWPAGFGVGGGGGPPIVAGAAGIPLWFGALMAAIPAAVGAVALKINSNIQDQATGLGKQTADFTKTASDADLKNSIIGLEKTIAEMGDGIGSNVFNQKGIAVEQLNALIAEFNHRNASSGGMSPTERDEAHAAAQGLQDVKDASQGTATQIRAMAISATLAKAGLHALGTGSVKSALHKLLSGIEARSLAKYGKAPTHAQIGATFGRDLLHTEKMVLKSHQTSATKLAGLERLEKIAVAGKDWGVAKKLAHDIAAMKRQAKTDANRLVRAQVAAATASATTTQAIKDKDLSITVPITTVTTVSLRDITLRQQTYSKMGRIAQ